MSSARPHLSAQNTAIVLDSTADFPEAPERFPNWRVVPLYVLFGDESYRDYVELAPAEFYARLRSADELPTTSQPTPGDFLETYEDLAGYERVYSLHISAALSGTYQSATTAASQLGDKVRTVDSESASAAIAMLVIFTVDTLEFLRRGGRIGRASAWAGQLLHVKPLLTIKREVIPLKRVRGNQKAMQEFVSQFTATTQDAPSLKVGIAHADTPGRAQQLRKMVRGERPQAEIEVVTTLGAVVGTHAGPGTVGFFWFDDRE